MTTDEWARTVYFRAAEFDSKGSPGSGFAEMEWSFVKRLDSLRAEWGKPMLVMSGYRTPAHNETVGGKPNSAHLRGLAADIKTHGLKDAARLIFLAGQHGFARAGLDLMGGFVHLDSDDSLPVAMWFYNDPAGGNA